MSNNTPGKMKTEAEVRYSLKELKVLLDKEKETLLSLQSHQVQKNYAIEINDTLVKIQVLEWVLGLQRD